jgi:hypothetical protein
LNKFLTTTLIVLTTSSLAFGIDFNSYDFQYTLGMSGNYVDSNNVKARVLSFDVGAVLKDEITPELAYHISLVGNFENGSNKATGLTAEFEPNQAVNLREGGLVYKPWEFLRLEVGALNQNKHMSPLLVWNNAFAGASQRISWEGFYLQAQEAIPNNNTLSRRIGGIDEGTPMFLIGTFGFEHITPDFKLQANISRFSFKDLSSQVARTSQDFGNSVIGVNESARFIYGFAGTNASSDLSWHVANGWLTSVAGEYLFNEKAPNGRNTGWFGELGIGKEALMLKAGAFRNESDTAPAFYNARIFGHNNVEGTIISFISKGKDYFVRGSLVNGKMIDENVRQSDFNIINFAIVRNYEL